MVKSLSESTANENSAITSYDGLMAAKTKEVNALTSSIEEKMVRLGELQVSVVEMKEDLAGLKHFFGFFESVLMSSNG